MKAHQPAANYDTPSEHGTATERENDPRERPRGKRATPASGVRERLTASEYGTLGAGRSLAMAPTCRIRRVSYKSKVKRRINHFPLLSLRRYSWRQQRCWDCIYKREQRRMMQKEGNDRQSITSCHSAPRISTADTKRERKRRLTFSRLCRRFGTARRSALPPPSRDCTQRP